MAAKHNGVYRTGTVAILGKPNAGKSTLMNVLVGAKLAAISPLPQTTRVKTLGILSDEQGQIIFADLPGLIAGTDKLNKCLRENVELGISGVDVVLHLVDVADDEALNEDMQRVLSRIGVPIVLAVNKVDGKKAKTDAACWVGEKVPVEVRNRYHAQLGISARDGRGLPELTAVLRALLPEGPPLYDEDSLTDRDLRFISAEMIREKLFLLMREEVPYSTAVEIEEFAERAEGKWYIRAVIYVERDSQKGIVIGKGGDMLKKISQSARIEIEKICDAPVFLELFVKVKDGWRRNESMLRQLGYKAKKAK